MRCPKLRLTLACLVGSLLAAIPAAAEVLEKQFEEHDNWNVRIWLPPNLPVIKGLVVVGDGSRIVEAPQLTTFAANLGFGVAGTAHHREDGPELFFQALDEFAQESGHPELSHVPFVAMGNSNGAALIMRMNTVAPERMIAMVPTVGVLSDVEHSDEALQTPALIGLGEWDVPWPNNPGIPFFFEMRERGAPWALVIEENIGHAGDRRRLWDAYFPYLEELIRARYPQDADPRQGPIELKPVDMNNGWLVQTGPVDGPLPTMAPADEYTGDRTEASWLPSKTTAWLFRAIATHDRPLDINADRPGRDTPTDFEYQRYLSDVKVFAPGEPVEITAKVYAAPWNRLELYHGTELINMWDPPQRRENEAFTVTPGPGAHSYSLLGFRNVNFQPHVSPPIRVFVSGGPGAIHSPWEDGEKPSILVQPIDQQVKENERVVLAAYAAGGPEVRYIWMKDGEPLDGFHSNYLELRGVAKEQAGSYQLKVENPHGAVQTETLRLDVNPHEGPVAVFTQNPPEVDGEREDVWSKAPVYEVANLVGGDLAEADEANAQFRLMWDRYNLYLLAEVEDPSVDAGADDYWSNDLLEVFLEGSGEKRRFYGEDAYQFILGRQNSRVNEVFHMVVPEDVKKAVQETTNGYRVEFQVPWIVLDRAPRAGDFFGFELYASFFEQGKLAFYNTADVAWEGPHRLESVKLVQQAPEEDASN